MMKDCLSAREAQFTRLINMTGAISDQVNKDTYEALLENATKFANESLPVCNKSDFLVVSVGGDKKLNNKRQALLFEHEEATIGPRKGGFAWDE